MWRSVIYDILKEGDRHLRGKIAELVFERVKSQLLGRALHCCSTLELSNFFWDLPSIDVNSLLRDYMANLSIVRDALGMEKLEELSSVLSSDDVRKNLVQLCLFCLKDGETRVGFWTNHYREGFYLCRNCLRRCVEKGFVHQSSTTFFDYEVSSKDEAFNGLVRSLVKATRTITRLAMSANAVEVLSKLNARARAFLREVYVDKRGRGMYGQHPFDYVCTDDQGNAYLVDVTSVRGLNGSPAQLSKGERQVAERAKKAGFRVLVPIVRFLPDWCVLIELMEI